MPRSLQRMSFPRPQGKEPRAVAGWALLLSLALFGQSETARADIYKTVGADGVISFTSAPKPGAKLYAKTEVKARLPSGAVDPSRFEQHIRDAAALYQIPVELVRAVIKVESNFDPRAISPEFFTGAHLLKTAEITRLPVLSFCRSLLGAADV